MPFDPNQYLSEEFDPDSYVKEEKSSFNPDSYVQDQDHRLHEKLAGDAKLFEDQSVSDYELHKYAETYGVEKDDLKNLVGWYGGSTEHAELGDAFKEGVKSTIGKAGNMLAFGAPGFIAKKMQDDPKLRLAADDLQKLISKKQSYTSDIAEIGGGIGTAIGLGKAAEASSKLPAMARKLYEPASALGGSAASGLFHSEEGKEGQAALESGLYGLGFYAGATGIGKTIQALGKGVNPKPREADSDVFERARESFMAEDTSEFKELLQSPDGVASLLVGPDRTRTLRFMEFVNSDYRKINRDFLPDVRKKVEPGTMERLDMDKVLEDYTESIRAGKVSDDTIDAFVLQDHITDELMDDNLQKILKREVDNPDIDDELQLMFKEENLLRKKRNVLNGLEVPLMRIAQAFRKVDDKVGTDFELLFNKAYSSNVKKINWERPLLDKFDEVKKLRYKNDMPIEQVYRDIQNPEVNTPVIKAYRDLWKDLLEASNENGLAIRDLGSTYVPVRKKSGVDLLQVLREKSDELRLLDMDAPTEKTVKEILRFKKDAPEEELGEWMNSFKGQRQDLAYLVHELERITESRIMDVEDLQRIVKTDLLNADSVRNAFDHQVAALFKRETSKPPEWLLETNVDKLFSGNVQQQSRQIFMEPVARQLSVRVPLLKSLGYDTESQYIVNYIQDILEISRSNKIADVARKKARMELWARESGPAAQAAKEMMDLSVQGFYASVMGARIDNVVRNLTQTFTKTVPEFSWTKGTGYLAGAMRDMAGDIITGGWRKAVREAEDVYNLKPKRPRPSDFEGIKNGITDNMDSKHVRRARQLINRYAEVTMSMYMKSDEINRVLTLNMSKRFVRELQQGNTENIKRVIDRWPSALKREIDTAIENGAEAQELTQLIAGHIIPETQVAYGSIGRAQLHRDLGKFIATLSDYPGHMISDASYKLNKDVASGAAQLIYNYFPSLLLFGAADMLVDKGDPTVQSVIGKRGFWSMHPVHSLTKVNDVVVSPHVSNVLKFGDEMLNAPSNKHRKRAVKKMIQNYGSLPGQLWKHSENVEKIRGK